MTVDEAMQSAIALHQAGQLAGAEKIYRKILAADPNHADALHLLGVPKQAMAYSNLAGELIAARRFDEGISIYRKALSLRPDDPLIHWNLGLALRQSGNPAEASREFAWGANGIWIACGHNTPRPQWKGEDIRGKTLALHDEGGFGDMLHYIRYVSLLQNRGLRLILECEPELHPLLAAMPGIDHVIPFGDALEPFDFQVALQSLPEIFKTNSTNVPDKVPYLKTPPEYIQRWRHRIRPAGLKVGLVWSGATLNRLPENRRLPSPDFFAALSQIRGVQYFSLQKGPGENDQRPPELNMAEISNDLHDFADTAAVIELLDLVISVDTSVAHLAGALAKPVWVLLNHQADIRWLSDRTDSPWYPTMRLFRQHSPNDFSLPISQVAQALKEMVR